MMTTINRPVVQGGRVVMGRDYKTGGNNPTNKDTAENKVDLTQSKDEVTALRTDLSNTTTTAITNQRTGQEYLGNGLKLITELANPTSGGINASSMAMGIAYNPQSPNGASGAIGKLGSSSPMGGALASILTGKDALGGFSKLAAALTGKSLGDVGKVMNVAQNLFKGGQLNLAGAAGFIAKALGLNEKAVGLIAMATSLMSNPFSFGAAMAVFQQAMAVMADSKSNHTQATAKKNEANIQQQQASQQVEMGERITAETIAMQEKIAGIMRTIKDQGELTEKQLKEFVEQQKKLDQLQKMNPNQPVAQNPATQNGQNTLQPQQQFQQQQIMQQNGQQFGAYAPNPAPNANQPNGNGLTIPFEIGGCFGEPKTLNMTMPSVVQPTTPTVGFSPPPFQSITA